MFKFASASLGTALFLMLAPTVSAACLVDDASWASQDGGCKDLVANRVWSEDAVHLYGGTGSFLYAQNYCANLAEGGFSDWRLPTAVEQKAAATHAIGTHVALGGTADGHYLWWSTSSKGKNTTVTDLRSGAQQTAQTASSYLYFICVR